MGARRGGKEVLGHGGWLGELTGEGGSVYLTRPTRLEQDEEEGEKDDRSKSALLGPPSTPESFVRKCDCSQTQEHCAEDMGIWKVKTSLLPS
ncbi:Hypothetical protein NTJ_09242 [Nesidiocoris tenuis]|uniref:Uncharacterized protein n=1 Tax=Nesidiocoris tenuis TaxID=355587 RepID=A0ABN7AW54_9HEMI|nr:Hypothetical protein NTJ_09242 [Nesidiocoris tenuis]